MRSKVGKRRSRDDTNICRGCGQKASDQPHSFAFLVGGALFMKDAATSVVHDKMKGFLALGVHGAHSEQLQEPSAVVRLLEEAPIGQFQLYFCSTPCMRLFLNQSVDALAKKF